MEDTFAENYAVDFLSLSFQIAVGRFILQCKQMNIVGTFIRVVYDLVP